jgi:uncharacterized phage-like protein YoqJ
MIEVCSAFGHREVFENISERISSAVRTAAEQGCEIFYTGAMGKFDKMFSSEVRALKKDYPNIKLICVMPYMTNEINTQGDYLYTLYDDILIPTELADVHYKAAITKRNQWIIQRSDLVIIYTRRNFGGAYSAKRYAQRMKKEIITI